MARTGYGYTPNYVPNVKDNDELYICGVNKCYFCNKWTYLCGGDVFCTYKCFGKYKNKEVQ